MGVTIKDIGKITGFSHTTVSRALNDNELISKETREKIKKVARELNYVPNLSAKSLVLDRSYIIGLFFSTIGGGTSSGFFHQAVIGIDNVIRDKYNVVVKGIDEYKDFSRVNPSSFDGIIVISQSDDDNPFICDVMEKDIPIVVLNRDINDERIVNILSDDRRGAYDIARHLSGNGHKKIAVIEGKANFKSSEVRRKGFYDAMQEASLAIPVEYIIKGEYDIKSGYNGMKKLLNLKDIPSAVFCFNDDMALGAINAAYESGIKVPEDISVAGFDDSIFSQYMAPSLTTVKRDIENMSMEGARCLINLINNESILQRKVYIKTELVVRRSTGKI